MSRDAFTVIKNKAEQHAKRFPAFDLERFLAWVRGKSNFWQERAAGLPTKMLNASRKNELFQVHVEANRMRRRGFTPEPADN